MQTSTQRPHLTQTAGTSITTSDWFIFALLIAIGVTGRLAPLAWNFTPLAAVTLAGAIYFRQIWLATLLPIGVLTLSNFMLPAHDSLPVMLSTYTVMLVPLLLGRKARNSQGRTRVAIGGLCGILPATIFFLVTNFAVWAFKSNYEPSMAGLAACYAAGIPFYRAMIAGDLCYMGILLACFAAARMGMPSSYQMRY